MSGHSKWSQIKHKKAATDAKKGKLFSRLSRAITIAAKEGSPDPATNNSLASAIDEARRANMPADNIERAIAKATAKDSGDLETIVYETYGPGGSALIITAITDNSNRTTSEIKHILSEHELKLAEQGSVLWVFHAENPSDIQAGKQKFTPNFSIELSSEDTKKFGALLETLSEHDDVQNIYSNVQ